MQSVSNLTNNFDVAFGTSGVRGLVKDLTPVFDRYRKTKRF
jgi:hypothetical protein